MRRTIARPLLASVAGLGLAAGAVLAVAAPASAASPTGSATGHDPIGALTSMQIVGSSIQLRGWAVDPDARTGNVAVSAVLDGTRVVAQGSTSLANAAVTEKQAAGSTPAYQLTMPLQSGRHTLCMVARNVKAGVSTTVGCRALAPAPKLSAAQFTARRPTGKVTSAAASASAVRYRGYVTDPDWRNAHLRVVLYVDNSARATVLTNGATAGVNGAQSAFDVSVPVSSGAHVGCVWAVNIGLGGGNRFLGCTPVDTRGSADTAPVTQPALNKAVMAEALKHRGQPYSWGAVGPKQFDCSGLVLYSYTKSVAAANATAKKAHTAPVRLSLPRVSQDQARLARLIPASRAVPGDLVFMFDSQGDVYHVGLYAAPGKIFAAIDYGYGVNYQTIWDPSSVMYGSVTHI